MLTLILLGMLGGTSWFGARQFKRARKAEAQLARIASTDDEVIAVLEASSSPMAERLLLAARVDTGKVPSKSAWRALVADLKMHDTELNRYVALENYACQHDLLVSDSQYVTLLRMFTSPNGYQTSARALLKTRRIERKRG